MKNNLGECEVIHTNWKTSLLVNDGKIIATCNIDPDFDEDNASDVEIEDVEKKKEANANRLNALWNMAEELNLTTEDIEKGKIQAAVKCMDVVRFLLNSNISVQVSGNPSAHDFWVLCNAAHTAIGDWR